MVKKIKHVVLNRRTPPPLCSSPFQGDSWMVATNDDPTIGTQENPYTLEEFNWLVLIGEWPGGWVEFFGFVPWNLADWYGSFSCSDNVSSYPDDDDDNDNDDDEHGQMAMRKEVSTMAKTTMRAKTKVATMKKATMVEEMKTLVEMKMVIIIQTMTV